jgi:hypothetical protein
LKIVDRDYSNHKNVLIKILAWSDYCASAKVAIGELACISVELNGHLPRMVGNVAVASADNSSFKRPFRVRVIQTGLLVKPVEGQMLV